MAKIKKVNNGLATLSTDIFLSQDKKTQEYILKTLSKEYASIYDDLSVYLERFYGKYADERGITYNNALRKLTIQELRQFKNELQQAINALKDKGATKAIVSDLTRLNKRTSITRLEALNAQIQADITNLALFKSGSVTALLGGVFKDSYYRTNFGLENSLGLTFDLTKLSKADIDTAIFAEFQGSDLGARLSASSQKLLLNVTNKLSQGFAAGRDLKIAKELLKSELNVNYNQLSTLVQTETARLCGEGTTKAAVNSYVVDQYQIIATLDEKTTVICRFMDGKVFNVKDMTPGLNAPPFHYNCRSVVAPYFNNNVFNEENLTQSGRAGWGIDSYAYGDWLKENGIE